MPLPKVIPALADLTQDIAGPVPVALLHNWANGEQDLATAETLLGEFEVEGTVVASDTSGLSRMTQASDLLDVLSLISQPKEIIHALGRGIGGRAIGTWVADNTEMFYPPELEPETVVLAMAEAQARIAERLRVRLGMCVHRGRFYEIGGGLYGSDADHVEYLAESCAGPGDILLTEGVADRLRKLDRGELVPKRFPNGDSWEPAWLFQTARRMPQLTEQETAYPHPFPPEFFALLPHFHEPGNVADLKQSIYSEWLRERIVVFLARQRQPQEGNSLGGLLDELVINALMDTIVREAAPGTDHLASSGGGLAILTFHTAQSAIDFVRTVHRRLDENGLPVLVGVDAGPVLLFQNSKGPSGIAGDPINIASKLAEDVGRPGCISVTDRAAQQMGNTAGHERFEIQVSGITLRGIILT